MHQLHRRKLLRDCWPISDDRNLCCGKLRNCGGECVLDVLCRLLPDRLGPIHVHLMPHRPIPEHNRANKLHCMPYRSSYERNRTIGLQQLHRGKLLRNCGPNRGHESVCFRCLFGIRIFVVHELFSRNFPRKLWDI